MQILKQMFPQQFTRTNHKHVSTHKTDYQAYPDHTPDKYPRREHAIAREGRPEQLLTRHHGNAFVAVNLLNNIFTSLIYLVFIYYLVYLVLVV